MNRLLLVMLLLVMVTTGFAKKNIPLEAEARFPIPSVEAFIDEESKELILNIENNSKNIRVVITDFSGNIICSNEVVVDGIFVLSLPAVTKGEYVLSLFFENTELRGSFSLE